MFKQTCDRLAGQGFVAFAPDLHHGKIAATVEETNHILETRDFPAAQSTAESAYHFLKTHPAVQGDRLSSIGFSMGAAFALLLDSVYPDAFDKIILFYGMGGADLSQSKARFQGHLAENDEWESLDSVKQMKFPNAEIFIYPDTSHWFFETDRPDHYRAQAADLAWERTLAFSRTK